MVLPNFQVFLSESWKGHKSVGGQYFVCPNKKSSLVMLRMLPCQVYRSSATSIYLWNSDNCRLELSNISQKWDSSGCCLAFCHHSFSSCGWGMCNWGFSKFCSNPLLFYLHSQNLLLHIVQVVLASFCCPYIVSMLESLWRSGCDNS